MVRHESEGGTLIFGTYGHRMNRYQKEADRLSDRTQGWTADRGEGNP